MSAYEIWSIIISILVVLGGIKWGPLIMRYRSLVKNAQEFKTKHDAAIVDGVIDPVEQAGLEQEAYEIAMDLIALWTEAVNIFNQLKRIVRR